MRGDRVMGHRWECDGGDLYLCIICGIQGMSIFKFSAGRHIIRHIIPLFDRDTDLSCEEIIVREIIE
jgi:hypothetical protein